MDNYSLYTYDCGSLKIFGWRDKRAHHATIEDAVQEYTNYIERLKRINKGKDVFVDKQVLIVKYTEPYQSEIVGIIKNGAMSPIKQ